MEVQERSSNSLLTFPWWQECLFAVAYVVNSSSEGGAADSRQVPVWYLLDALMEVLRVFLETLQLALLLLPDWASTTSREAFMACGDGGFELSLGCGLRTIASPWMPAAGTDRLSYLVIIGVLCLVAYAMAGLGCLVGITFQAKEAQWVWPIIFLKSSVKLMISTFFTSVVRDLLTTFSCSWITNAIVTSPGAFVCWDVAHIAITAAAAIGVALLIPIGFIVSMLYSTFEITNFQASARTHGRAEALLSACKVVVPVTAIAVVSIDDASGKGVCRVANLLFLGFYLVCTCAWSPQTTAFMNRIKAGCAGLLVALAIVAFLPDPLGGAETAGVSLIGFIVGIAVATYRREQFRKFMRRHFFEAKGRFSPEYNNVLVSLIFEECQAADEQQQANDDSMPRQDEEASGDELANIASMHDGASSVANSSRRKLFMGSVQDVAADIPAQTGGAVKNMLVSETDMALLFEMFVEDWSLMSENDKLMAKAAMNEVFLGIFRSQLHREFAYMWYAVLLRELFNDYLTSQSFLRLAMDSCKQLDLSYLAYRLQKQIETARQTAHLGAKAHRFNLNDLVNFRRFSENAKTNHRKAVQGMLKLFHNTLRDDLARTDVDEEGPGTKALEHQEMLKQALLAVRDAETSYARLLRAFPKSGEASVLAGTFSKQMYSENMAEDLLKDGRNDDKSNSESSSVQSEGTRAAMSPKQEFIRSYRQQLVSVVRFTRLATYASLVLMAVVVVLISGIGVMQKNTMVESNTQYLRKSLDMQGTWIELCKSISEVPISLNNRGRSLELLTHSVATYKYLLARLEESLLFNADALLPLPPSKRDESDVMQQLFAQNNAPEPPKSNSWELQLQILNNQTIRRIPDLEDPNDSLVKGAKIPLIVNKFLSKGAKAIRNYRREYMWPLFNKGEFVKDCRRCDFRDVYVIDKWGNLVAMDIAPNGVGDHLETEVGWGLIVSRRAGKTVEEMEKIPVDPMVHLWFHQNWDGRLDNVNVTRGSIVDPQKFQPQPETPWAYGKGGYGVHVMRLTKDFFVPNELHVAQVTKPIYPMCKSPKCDSPEDLEALPIGWLETGSSFLPTKYLDEVLERDAKLAEKMEEVKTRASSMAANIDEQLQEADDSNNALLLKGLTEPRINVTTYMQMAYGQSRDGLEPWQNEYWNRHYKMESFQGAVTEMSSVMIAVATDYLNYEVEDLLNWAQFQFVSENCGRGAQEDLLNLLDIETENTHVYIQDKVIVLVAISVCVICLNIVTCFAMQYGIQKNMAEFERRDPQGLSLSYKLIVGVPTVTKKNMAKRFRQYTRDGFSNMDELLEKSRSRSALKSSKKNRGAAAASSDSDENEVRDDRDTDKSFGNSSNQHSLGGSDHSFDLGFKGAGVYSKTGTASPSKGNTPTGRQRRGSNSGLRFKSAASDVEDNSGLKFSSGAKSSDSSPSRRAKPSVQIKETPAVHSIPNKGGQDDAPKSSKIKFSEEDKSAHATGERDSQQMDDLMGILEGQMTGSPASPPMEGDAPSPNAEANIEDNLSESDLQSFDLVPGKKTKGDEGNWEKADHDDAQPDADRSPADTPDEPEQGKNGLHKRDSNLTEPDVQPVGSVTSAKKLRLDGLKDAKQQDGEMKSPATPPSRKGLNFGDDQVKVFSPSSSPNEKRRASLNKKNKQSVEDELEEKQPGEGCLQTYVLGWHNGYLRRWITLLWTCLIGYSIAVLMVVRNTLVDFGTFQEDMTLTQKINFELQTAGTLLPDVVTYDRMPWRTYTTEKLREKFDTSVSSAVDKLANLIPSTQGSSSSSAFRYPARRDLLFKPGCLRAANDCDKREDESAYEGSSLMEQGLYRSTNEFMRRCREARNYYADSKRSSLVITTDEPADYWFLRNSLAEDLTDGLKSLILSYLNEATSTQDVTTNTIWAVCGGGIGAVFAGFVACVILLSWQWQQVEDVLTVLRLLPWQDVQQQKVLDSAKNLQRDREEIQDSHGHGGSGRNHAVKMEE